MQEADRPRERMLAKGAHILTDRELLAIVLGSGSKKNPVFKLAEALLGLFDSKGALLDVEHLLSLPGLGTAKSLRVIAAQEFFRRRLHPRGEKIQAPMEVLKYIGHFAAKKQEHFICLYLNGAHELIETKVITVGLLNQVPIHPREVFEPAISLRAAGIILAHNHPTVELAASSADVQVTKKLIKAGHLLGVTVLDHIIFNQYDFLSLKESNYL